MFAFFIAANHLSGSLRKQKFVIGGFRSALCLYVASLLVIVIILTAAKRQLLNFSVRVFLKSAVIRPQNWLLIATKTREFNTLLCSLTIYKITQIVRTLWLAERRVCMRVYKHGCYVKMFCFSRADHASTNLKKVLSLKTRRQVYFFYLFPCRLKLGKSLQTCCVNFFFAWADILNHRQEARNMSIGEHRHCCVTLKI